MSELKMNRLTIQDGHIFLDDKEIRCVEEFNLKSSTGSTAELSLKLLVDNVRVNGSFDIDKIAKELYEKLCTADMIGDVK